MDRKRKALAMMLLMDEIENYVPNNAYILLKRPKLQIQPIFYSLCLSERNIHYRLPLFYEVWVNKYLETDYFNLFRMTRNTMNILTTLIAPLYIEIISIYHSGGLELIPVQKCTMMTIWYLGKGETLISTADRFDVATSTAFRVIHHIIECINKLLPKYICWPTREECSYISQEFYKRARYPGVIGAIDGCHVECKIPIKQHDSYQDRKFKHSLTLQAICTANRILTDISVGWPGSIHDARILKESAIGRHIQIRGVKNYFYNDDYHLVGDSAYPLKSWMMVPYRDNGRLTVAQKKHNTMHSVTRVIIENLFGLLKGRWRILEYINVYSVERAIKIITACCVLHNFCLINKDNFTDFKPISQNDINYSLPNTEQPDILASIKRNNICINL